MATNKLLTTTQAQQIANDIINKVKNKNYALASSLGAMAAKDEVAKTDLASALSTEITNATSNISTLVGSDTGKSARTIAAEELAAQLIPQDAQEALDTLQEIAAWIQAHPADVAAINAKLTLGTHEVSGEQVQYANVKAYVEAYVAEQIGDAELNGSDAISIVNNIVSIIIDTANANGLEITSSGLKINLATTSAAGAMSASDKSKLDNADVTAYTQGNGIAIANHVVSAVVDSTNANGLSVGSNGIALAAATSSAAGAMSAADKAKLDDVEVASAADIAAVIAALDSL